MNARVRIEYDGMTEPQAARYQEGRTARRGERGIDSCPYCGLEWRAFWLAGFHDEDMAQGNRIYQGPERPRRAEQ